MTYLLIGYMWLFVHRPFEVWPWLGELHIERIYILVTLAYWVTQPKTWTANRVNVGAACLAASITLSTLLGPLGSFASIEAQNWYKLLFFYVLVMTSVREYDDFKVLVIGFVAILGLYELHSLREYFNGRGQERMGIWRMVGVDASLGDPNSFAASVNYGIPMLLPVAALVSKRWQKWAIGGLLMLAVTCIVLTGSRGGFVGLTLTLVTIGLVSKYRWRLLPLLLIAAVLLWASLSDKLRNRYWTLIDPSVGPANAEESAESRKVFFFIAVDIWQHYPIFGVGPGGYPSESGTGMNPHSLYAMTISELGTVGAIAMCVLSAGFFVNFRTAYRIYKSSVSTVDTRFCYFTVCAAGFAALLLLILGFGSHNLYRYTWLWYAAFSSLALRFLLEHVRSDDEAVSEGDSSEFLATEMVDGNQL